MKRSARRTKAGLPKRIQLERRAPPPWRRERSHTTRYRPRRDPSAQALVLPSRAQAPVGPNRVAKGNRYSFYTPSDTEYALRRVLSQLVTCGCRREIDLTDPLSGATSMSGTLAFAQSRR